MIGSKRAQEMLLAMALQELRLLIKSVWLFASRDGKLIILFFDQ
ncbi:MAG: hypothetical protein R3E79_59425 [Caldilineaceae bacterium]